MFIITGPKRALSQPLHFLESISNGYQGALSPEVKKSADLIFLYISII
jgi:hypothetical protein